MGLSASQAKLLTLTARLSDLEFSAQRISNSKMRLSSDSEKVSENYLKALNNEKLSILTGYSNGAPTYGDLTYESLASVDAYNNLGTQYGLSNSNGQLLVTRDIANKFEAAGGDEEAFLIANGAGHITVYPEGYEAAKEAYESAYQENYDFWADGGLLDNYIDAEKATAAAKTAMDAIGQLCIENYGQDTVTTDSGRNNPGPRTGDNDENGGRGSGNRPTSSFDPNGNVTGNSGTGHVGGAPTKTTTPFDYDPTKVTYLGTATAEQKTAYQDAYNAWIAAAAVEEDALKAFTSAYGDSLENIINYYSNQFTNAKAALDSLGLPSIVDAPNSVYYENLYRGMSENGYYTVGNESEEATLNNAEWIQSQIESGNLTLKKVIADGKWVSTSTKNETNISSDTDDADIARAEAQYDSDMAKIENKDKRYDLELKKIDTEHSAIQTEVDSVKKVIDKNIERTFKSFDA